MSIQQVNMLKERTADSFGANSTQLWTECSILYHIIWQASKRLRRRLVTMLNRNRARSESDETAWRASCNVGLHQSQPRASPRLAPLPGPGRVPARPRSAGVGRAPTRTVSRAGQRGRSRPAARISRPDSAGRCRPSMADCSLDIVLQLHTILRPGGAYCQTQGAGLP